MSLTFEDIRHDGGTHRVEVEIEGDQCVLRFGSSFTLRVNEANLNTLREMIHDASRDLMLRENDLLRPGRTFEIPEKDFIRHVNQSQDEL